MAKEKSLKEHFNDDIAQHNANIEYYRELVPTATPLIEKYCDYFTPTNVSQTESRLTPTANYKLPPMFFCECLEAGILAKEVESYGMHYSSCHVVMVLNKC